MKKCKKVQLTRLSVSEARAEASALLLQCLLADMPAKRAVRVCVRATQEAAQTGLTDVLEEMRWLCGGPPEV